MEPGIDDGHSWHAPAGSFAPNDFGLHDTHGNVLEWCADRFGPYLESKPGLDDGLRSPLGTKTRVARGGNFHILAMYARSGLRLRFDPGSLLDALGLRPLRLLSP